MAVDRGALVQWVQPQHLQDDALSRYRATFTSSPARFILLKDFLLREVAERLNQFLSSEADFVDEYGLYSSETGVTGEQWQRAPEADRFFRLGKLTGVKPQFLVSPNTLTYVKFRQNLLRGEFQRFFETVSGMSLGPSDDFGAHSMRAGDFLRPHSDNNRNRQLALVLYLTPGWHPSFGSSLIIAQSGQDPTEVRPEFNSLVAFDVAADTVHHVTPVTPAAEGRCA